LPVVGDPEGWRVSMRQRYKRRGMTYQSPLGGFDC
jgi:hypothetical protein